jgi:peptidoglycan hydrolase-like protein with peptidoglycan-binding domain
MKLRKIFIVPLGMLIMGGVSQASMMDQLIYNVAGQATNAAGARLGDEIYYGGSRKAAPPPRRVHHKKRHKKIYKKKHKKKRVVSAPVITDQHRIQKALTSLGFYHGKIDGQANSFETRSAIKEMNKAYGISQTSSLKPEAKDALIFMGTLFSFDRYLIANSSSQKSKNKKIQVALKIHGYYHSGIDGSLGRGSRKSISEYKNDNGMSPSGSLNFEEEYQLISSAKEKNDKNLDETIQSLRSIGSSNQPQVQNTTQQAYVPKPVQTNVQHVPAQEMSK